MLIEFRVENFRSIRSEQVLSFEAAKIGDPADPVPREVAGSPTPLLPALAIYGANASGKSNVLRALAFMHEAVIHSSAIWKPEKPIARQPFAMGSSATPSTFEITWVIQGCRYEYGFVASDTAFEEEWLYAFPSGRKQVWLARERADFRFGDQLRGENKSIEKLTRPNALYLSTAAQFSHEQLMPIYSEFLKLNAETMRDAGSELFTFDLSAIAFDQWAAALLESEGPGEAKRIAPKPWQEFVALMKAADVGIEEIRLEKLPRYEDTSATPRTRLLFRHGSAWLPLHAESAGTQAIARMIPSVLGALGDGGMLLVDELEESLHPLLAVKLVRLFNERKTNSRNAQLLFTTHDTNLLGNPTGHPLLRRDQIWFTEKDKEGATRLYPLTDYKPRKAENLERGYLQGRYGAIPFLGSLLPGELDDGKA